jgi:hypothetical protein
MWTFDVDCVLTQIRPSHVWLFEGAEGGKWLSDFEAARVQAAQISDLASNALSSPVPSMVVGDTPRDAKRARVL